MRTKYHIAASALLLSFSLSGLAQEDTIKRSVTLYNPYKPSLKEAEKRAVMPPADDTATVKVDFTYNFVPGSFVPQYNVSKIKSAVLSPEPLPGLKKGYVNLGLGTYLTPFLEVNVSNGRSREKSVGLYTRSYLSGGRMKLENDDIVNAGFMDNEALLYGKKYFRRARLDGDIDFLQMTRFAYGYDTRITGWEPDKKDIRADYYDLTGRVRYLTMEPDSENFNWDATVKYNLFSRTASGTQHNPGLNFSGGMNMFGFYGGATLDYDLWLFADKPGIKPRNLFMLSPYITKGNSDWRFRIGVKMALDARESTDPLESGSSKTYAYVYPDLSLTFAAVPNFLRLTATVDGSLENNQARNIAYVNPYLIPGDTLFTLRSTSNKLRAAAKVSGNLDVNATYAAEISYTMSDDMLFFVNDTMGVGNYFLPVYDNGDLMKVHAEVSTPVSRLVKIGLDGNYYRYSLTELEHPWHMPDWDGTLTAVYNLRNKIVATAAFTMTGRRYAMVKAPEKIVSFDMHPNFNLGVVYNYTREMSFWLKCNNLSWKKYYEWNYYPAHNFMIMAGFTYSL